MKNSMKVIMGVVLAIFLIAGSGYGQENVQSVRVYNTVPAKPAKNIKATKTGKVVRGTAITPAASCGETVTVVGYATDPATAVSTGTVAVQGYALPVNDKVSTQRRANLAFKGESKPSEVKVKVSEDQGYLKIRINSSFRTGSVSVELIDPKGENRGKYMLKTDDLIVTGDKTTVTEEVTGEMEKDFTNPLKGEWIIRAIPVSAEGSITVDIFQESFPGMQPMAPMEVIGQPLPDKKR